MNRTRVIQIGLLVLIGAVGCAQVGPGIYAGDASQTCDEICAEQVLMCDGRHVWHGLLSSSQGGGQRRYSGPDGERTTEEFQCDQVPPETIEVFGVLQGGAFECACIEDPGGLVDVIDQSVGTGVYEGTFTLSELATVTYQITDNFRLSPNMWRIAMVPAASVQAFVDGESPLVYGGFDGAGSTSATVSMPAGDYALLVDCRNLASVCNFDAFVSIDE